jgi:hypothetical protein
MVPLKPLSPKPQPSCKCVQLFTVSFVRKQMAPTVPKELSNLLGLCSVPAPVPAHITPSHEPIDIYGHVEPSRI